MLFSTNVLLSVLALKAPVQHNAVLCDVSQYCSFDAVGCGCDVLLQNSYNCKTSTNPLSRTERQLLEMKAVVVAELIIILNGSHPSSGPSNPLKNETAI